MPFIIFPKTKLSLDTFAREYTLSSGRWWYNAPLGEALQRYIEAPHHSALQFTATENILKIVSESRFWESWFSSPLSDFKNTALMRVFNLLKEHDVIRYPHGQTILTHILQNRHLEILENCLTLMSWAHLTSSRDSHQTLMNLLIRHSDLKSIEFALRTFWMIGLLNPHRGYIICCTLFIAPDPEAISDAIQLFIQHQYLTGPEGYLHIERLLQHLKPRDFAKALLLLEEAELPLEPLGGQTFLHDLSNHSDPLPLAKAMIYLDDYNLLEGEEGKRHYETLYTHPLPCEWARMVVVNHLMHHASHYEITTQTREVAETHGRVTPPNTPIFSGVAQSLATHGLLASTNHQSELQVPRTPPNSPILL